MKRSLLTIPCAFVLSNLLLVASVSATSEFPSCQKYDKLPKKSKDTVCCENKIDSHHPGNLKTLEKELSKVEKNQLKEQVLIDIKSDILKTVNQTLSQQTLEVNCLKNAAFNKKCPEILKATINETRTLYPLLRAHLALDYIPFLAPPKNDKNFLAYQRNIEHVKGDIKLSPIAKHEEVLIKKLASIDKANSSFQNLSSSERIQDLQLNRLKSDIAKDHRNVALEIMSYAPHLIYFSKDSLATNDAELKKHILSAKERLLAQSKIEFEKLQKKPSDDYTFAFKYPHLVEDYLKRKNPSKNLCEVTDNYYNKYKSGGRIDIMQDVGMIAGGILGAGACVFSAGTVCGVVVAVGVEVAFVTKDQFNLNQARSLEKVKLVDNKKVQELENNRNLTLALAPVALIGVNSVKSASKITLKITNPNLFKKSAVEWLHFSSTSALQNAQWIKIAKSNQAHFFLDVENAALKRLNDSLGNKNVVTSLTNLHKKILFDKMNTLLSKYKDVNVSKYSDFKSSRFAFEFKNKKMPVNFENDLRETLNQVSKEFDSQVSKIGGLDLGGNVPSKWFSSGMGETADQAGIISRLARSRTGAAISFAEARKIVNEKRLGTENLRKKVATQINKSLLTIHSNGATLPNLKVFEVLRKNLSKSDDELIKIFKEKFNIQISQDDATLLKNYYKEVDSFSPGLWVEKREVANLDLAHLGGFSSDFKAMGATNLRQTAFDLSFAGETLEKSIARLRGGEQLVTQSFTKQKKNFQNLIDLEMKRMGIGVKTVCSGDDCVSIPTRALKQSEEELLVKKIATSGNPDAYRISFIKAGVKPNDRTMLSVHGELIEKQLREELSGFTAGKLKPSVLENMTIAIRMPATLGQGKVELIVAGGKTTPVSAADLKIIQDKFASAINNINQAIKKETKKSVTYRP